ncbi:hypothetical protein [Paraburkholderia phymatum]|uniref:hypothetical protein n=1 Tax=Paraburkholderia phymatum TaxID=148447 RepID=UPI003D1720EF
MTGECGSCRCRLLRGKVRLRRDITHHVDALCCSAVIFSRARAKRIATWCLQSQDCRRTWRNKGLCALLGGSRR